MVVDVAECVTEAVAAPVIDSDVVGVAVAVAAAVAVADSMNLADQMDYQMVVDRSSSVVSNCMRTGD